MDLELKYYPYNLELKHQFTISGNTRSHTPLILTELHYKNFTGYGEASLPPYLEENQQTVTEFLSKVDLTFIRDIKDFVAIEDYISSIMDKNYAAKASLSIALFDLLGKIENRSAREILNIPFQNETSTSLTIGIDSPEMIKMKIQEAEDYEFLKIKLGTEYDRDIIKIVRSVTEKALYIDANQGWKTKEHALEMIEFLSANNVMVVEQPLPTNTPDECLWLKERSPLPVIADESIKTLSDLLKNWELFHGINIKLMKCGGMLAALEMIRFCKEKNLKIMIGCMTETSCAITAAADLAVYADFVDLDGNVLIKNDPFKGAETSKGKIIKNTLPGFGISPK